jgi:hypothetical protein
VIAAGLATLSDVLPAVAHSLGAPMRHRSDVSSRLVLAPARRSVVVLIDGLGRRLLERRRGHAPFLRSLLAAAPEVVCGFPSTTATSMGSFGTGLPPGAHGLVGYEVRDPQTGAVFNELSWEGGPDPRHWQPHQTVFEHLEASGVAAVRIGPGFFDGSGLTTAALRGGRFVAAQSLSARVDAALEAIAATPRALVYLYWGDLDKVGHVHGSASAQWCEELERIDADLARLAARLGPDTSLHITADHGMVDVPFADRVDLAAEPELLAGVEQVGGEPRAVQLYCTPGAAPDVAAAWTDRLGPAAAVGLRSAVEAEGRFGPVDDPVRDRIGDVIVCAVSSVAIVDSARMRPELLALVGLHGSITEDETDIPVLSVPARAVG